MAFNYDKLYAGTGNALGEPTPVFTDFFDRFDVQHARVLDIGCGQGRDALFIARRGHSVVGVDIAANGIRDLDAVAKREGLAVEGIVADITSYTPDGAFDVIVIDRTLHMLAKATRRMVLHGLLDRVGDHGWVLIADETANIKDFQAVIANHDFDWTTHLSKRGYLFVRRS